MSDFPKRYLVAQFETATLEAAGEAFFLGTAETTDQRRVKAQAFLLDAVTAALAGDPHTARALMQVIAWRLREDKPLPAALRYYVDEAFARIVADGEPADRAFGLAIGHAPGAHPHAREYRYGRLVARVDSLQAEGLLAKQIYYTIAQEGLPALDGSGRVDHPTPEAVRKEYTAAKAWITGRAGAE